MTRELLPTSESAPSVQEEIFTTLLRTPHRAIDETLAIHGVQFERDPQLYGQFAVWAVHYGNCAIRDLCDIFIATLFVSPYAEHRSAAFVMAQSLPPFRLVRVLNYTTGYTEYVRHASIDSPMPPQKQFGVTWERAKYSMSHHVRSLQGRTIPQEIKKVTKAMRRHFALRGLRNLPAELKLNRYLVNHACYGKKSPNRVLKNAILAYLRLRERDENQTLMEGACLRAPEAMLTLYCKCHILPQNNEDGWVNQYLFHGFAPEGTRLEAMKRLIASTDPTEQAEIIMEANLPYPVVHSLIETITPSILISFVESMSPQELLANLGSLRQHGVFDNPELKALVNSKIELIKKVGRGKVDAFKGLRASQTVKGLDKETVKLVEEVTDAQLKHHGQIRMKTLLAIDKSSSMTGAIDLGKDLGAAIAQACISDFSCYVFDAVAKPISWTSSDGDIGQRSNWERKLKMVNANGSTNLGAVVTAMLSRNIQPEQIVIVTDEGENGHPTFSEELERFKKKWDYLPNIVIIRLGSSLDKIERSCKNIGAQVDVFRCNNVDMVSMPNILQVLSRKSIFDLIQEILELDLPEREIWEAKNKPRQAVMA